MEGHNVPDDYEPDREVWRSSFLRALVEETEEGSIAQVQRHANAHPQATHEFFTQRMTVWMLEDKTYPWYDFVGATALFVASAYARKEVVRWLVAHGSDPSVMCKFPGMDLHSETKTLAPVDVVGQFTPGKPAAELEEIRTLLTSHVELKAPPMPSMSMKCSWHAWTELVPYQMARYKEGDAVLAGWHGSAETFSAVVKRVNTKARPQDEQTYRILFEPPDGGYYRPQIKKGRNGEADVEILYAFKDGKLAPPLYVDEIRETDLTSPDGSVPEPEERFRRVLFTQLRAKVGADAAPSDGRLFPHRGQRDTRPRKGTDKGSSDTSPKTPLTHTHTAHVFNSLPLLFLVLWCQVKLDWTAFWVPTKTYCKELKHQMRYRNASGANEWTNVPLDVPRATLKGLYLDRTYEVRRASRTITVQALPPPKLYFESTQMLG